MHKMQQKPPYVETSTNTPSSECQQNMMVLAHIHDRLTDRFHPDLDNLVLDTDPDRWYQSQSPLSVIPY